MKHERTFRSFKMILIFLIIKSKPLHHEKVMVSFHGVTVKPLESSYFDYGIWSIIGVHW